MKRIGLILVGLISLVVSGCGGTKVVTIDVPRIEKEYVVKSDTVHRVDSVYISNDRYIVKDTVYNTKISEKFRYVYKTRVDTLVRCDTITLIDTKQIKALTDENDKLKATMNFYRHLGLSLLVIIGMMGIYIYLEKIRK